MKIRIGFLAMYLLLSFRLIAQNTDTLLNTVISKPYFYNLIEGKEGKIFAGTSDGIFEIKDIQLRQYDSRVGYLTTNQMGEPIIDSNGIRYYKEKQYQHLLPYPEFSKEEYHATAGKQFYISSGGRLYVFDILNYDYSYPNHSFRAISRNFLGTYSGVYLNGKKLGLPAPNFVDGNIREFGDRAFLCNYSLFVMEKDAIETGQLRPGENCFNYYDPENHLINDIFPSPDNRYYYLATQNKLVQVDHDFKNDKILYRHDKKDAPIVLITESPYKLYFTSKNAFYSLLYSSGKIDSIVQFNEPILAGSFFENQFYLLTGKGLYRLNSGQEVEKMVDIDKAHSLVKISGSEFVISSDHGLFLFNVSNRILSVIIKGVEFNRRALYCSDDMIYAGSLNGLYKISIKDIPKLVEDNRTLSLGNNVSNFFWYMLILFFVAVLVGAMLIVRLRRKLKAAEIQIENIASSNHESITREMIEEFVANNLANASIKSIQEKFDLNTTKLYAILKPDQPGSIIQELRIETVRDMRSKGKSIHEISQATGLSISYLRKFKTI